MEIDPPPTPFRENVATADDWMKALNKVVPAVVVLNPMACCDFDIESIGACYTTEMGWGSLLRIKKNLVGIDAGLFKQVEIQEVTGDSNPRQVTERGNSILHVAAKFGKVEIMKKVLDSQPSLLYMTNCKGNTALHIAAIFGNVDTTKLLITSAKDKEVETRMELLRMQNQEKNTALHEAIRNYRYDIVELLIREDPGLALFTNNAEESPLFLAVDLRFYKIALHILEAVPNCSYGGIKGMNVLHAAVINRPKIGLSTLDPFILGDIAKDALISRWIKAKHFKFLVKRIPNIARAGIP
ncbi:ankyrin repeat-containing protein [Fagus crenata]